MIIQKLDGFYVISHSGKNLGGPYKTREAALSRLKAVEYFKNKNAGPEVLKAPSKYSLQEIFAELKFGRPADSQKYLQKQIDYLNGKAKTALQEKSLEEVRKLLSKVHVQRQAQERTIKLMTKNPSMYTFGDAVSAHTKLKTLENRDENLLALVDRNSKVRKLLTPFS